MSEDDAEELALGQRVFRPQPYNPLLPAFQLADVMHKTFVSDNRTLGQTHEDSKPHLNYFSPIRSSLHRCAYRYAIGYLEDEKLHRMDHVVR